MTHRLWDILTWWYGHYQTSIAEVSSKTRFLRKTVFIIVFYGVQSTRNASRQKFLFFENSIGRSLTSIENLKIHFHPDSIIIKSWSWKTEFVQEQEVKEVWFQSSSRFFEIVDTGIAFFVSRTWTGWKLTKWK